MKKLKIRKLSLRATPSNKTYYYITHKSVSGRKTVKRLFDTTANRKKMKSLCQSQGITILSEHKQKGLNGAKKSRHAIEHWISFS